MQNHFQSLPLDDEPEPLLSDGHGGVLIPTLLYRLMYIKAPCVGHIVRYLGGGQFSNARGEVIAANYDHLNGVILQEATEGFEAQTIPTAKIPNNKPHP